MNLYFISAPDPKGTDDHLDAFVYAPDEITAYDCWRLHLEKKGQLPLTEATPNHDLYLVPYDPMLRSRGVACVIPWSFDGTGGVDGSGTVQLISSSWIDPSPEPPPPVDDGSCDPLYGQRMDSADLGEC